MPKLSPFRYPGGKTWLVPVVRRWLSGFARKPKLFVEPFAGGGIIGLTAVIENLVERTLLVELDAAVSAVWKTALCEDCKWLQDRILDFRVSRAAVVRELDASPVSTREMAFQTIIRNRMQRGGILAPGASLIKEGENGKGLLSRWYPETLAKRLAAIYAHRDRIGFEQGDAFSIIPRYKKARTTTFFVDPPYTAGGKSAGSRLYRHSAIDHSLLFETLSNAAGPVMLTYDDNGEVRNLATSFSFSHALVPMKNTHHACIYELVITNGAAARELSDRKVLAEHLKNLRPA